MDKPKRIQRKRTKGWKMPPNTVYVGRSTIWGNPWGTADDFRKWLLGELRGGGGLRRLHILSNAGMLRGKNLACWCPLEDKFGRPVSCHADVLLDLANS